MLDPGRGPQAKIQQAENREAGNRAGAARRPAAGKREPRNRAPGSSEAGNRAGGEPEVRPHGRPVTRPSLASPCPRRGPAQRPTRRRPKGQRPKSQPPRQAAGATAAGGKAEGRKAREHKSAQPAAQTARGAAAIPGLDVAADVTSGHQGAAYRRHHPSPARKPVSETRAQQAFISQIAPGAIAAQHRYGVPAAVTIAQAIDESGWGQSQLAAREHNLFGIKGTGPAGSVPMPTQEYVNGQPVSTSASFRVYHDAAESIEDHGRLLAHSGYYQQAMAERQHPDKFAAALTGVYATDPNYGANLISLMRRYDLYRYSNTARGPARPRAGRGEAGQRGHPGGDGHRDATSPAQRVRESARRDPAADPDGQPRSRPGLRARSRPGPPAREPTRTATPQPTRTASPEPTRTASPQPHPDREPAADPDRTARQPTGTASPAAVADAHS